MSMLPERMKSPNGHEWVLSTVGHGEYQCRHCQITNREAWAIGTLNSPCKAAPKLELVNG